MFKEIGALIDAAGKAAAESLRVSANAVRKALSDEDDNDGRTMGILTPDPKELEEEISLLIRDKTIRDKTIRDKTIRNKTIKVKLDENGEPTDILDEDDEPTDIQYL